MVEFKLRLARPRSLAILHAVQGDLKLVVNVLSLDQLPQRTGESKSWLLCRKHMLGPSNTRCPESLKPPSTEARGENMKTCCRTRTLCRNFEQVGVRSPDEGSPE
eukprot:4324929-Amphidinium_carterae.1